MLGGGGARDLRGRLAVFGAEAMRRIMRAISERQRRRRVLARDALRRGRAVGRGGQQRRRNTIPGHHSAMPAGSAGCFRSQAARGMSDFV
jgi:hypothetical protein